jgi:hypothetical protein
MGTKEDEIVELGTESAEEEMTEAEEGGRDELSPVDGGMEVTGDEYRTIGSSGHRAIRKAEGEFAAKGAKVAKQKGEFSREQTRTSTNEDEVVELETESAEQEEVDPNSIREAEGADEFGGGALPHRYPTI